MDGISTDQSNRAPHVATEPAEPDTVRTITIWQVAREQVQICCFCPKCGHDVRDVDDPRIWRVNTYEYGTERGAGAVIGPNGQWVVDHVCYEAIEPEHWRSANGPSFAYLVNCPECGATLAGQ
jgi:hypothetical protein